MTAPAPNWKETYAGGSPEAEKRMFDAFSKDVREIHGRVAHKTGRSELRTLHAKILVGVRNAELLVDHDLPIEFAAGYFKPGERLSVIARFSNASPMCLGDARQDMRGAALRIDSRDGRYHDLLMTSYHVSHARDARQFIEVAKIATGPKALVLPRGPQGVSDLASLLRMDFGTLSPMLKRLESKGMVTRRRQATDERRVLVDLTPRGASIRKRTEQMLGEFYCFLNMPLDELFDLKDRLRHFVNSAGPKEMKTARLSERAL